MKVILNNLAKSSQTMKKLLVIMFAFVFIFAAPMEVDAAVGIGTDIGDILDTNIVTYINGYYIPSFNVDGYTVVMCHELDKYGFNTSYDSVKRIVRLSYDSNKAINSDVILKTPEIKSVVGKKVGDVRYTDIEVYIDNRKIPSFNIDGYTAILTQDLNAFGEVKWNPESRTVSVTATHDHVGNLGVRLFKNTVTNNYFDNTTNADLVHVYYNLETSQYEVEDDRIPIAYYPTYGGGSSKGYTKDFSPREYPTKLLLGTILKGIDRYVTVNESQEMINSTYESDFAYLKSPHVLNVALKLESINPTKYKSLADEFAKNSYVPLKVTGVSITYNSIGIPEANIDFKNVSQKQIRAIELTFRCYDDFGRPVNRFLDNHNTFYGIAQGISIESGATYGLTWTLNLYDLTTNIKNISITKVAYSDGTVWSK